MKIPSVARDQLASIAGLATDLGFQVTFINHVETEGSAAGKTLIGITISTLTVEA